MPWNGDRFETERWHYIEAANNSGPRDGNPRVLVVHTAETPEGDSTAVAIGNWFASGRTVGSTHAGVDGSPEGDGSPSTCQYVWDALVAHGAPGVNHDGLHCEIAGRAAQGPDGWDDPYSRLAVDRAANVMAQWSLKYDIPIRHLTDDELRRGESGMIGHVQASRVYHRSDHTDPGPDFPWARFAEACRTWRRFWLSQHPDFDDRPAEPDFRVVVMADTDVDEGIARVYGAFNRVKFLRWPVDDVTFGAAVLVGRVGRERDAIERQSVFGQVAVHAGAGRRETAAKVAGALAAGVRSDPLAY